MKAYRTEIKPNKEQIELIHQTFGNTDMFTISS